MAEVKELGGSLIADRLAVLRDETTPLWLFRLSLEQVSYVLAASVLSELPLREVAVRTPLETMTGQRLVLPPILVPILRAGLGLMEGFLRLCPEAPAGHVGLQRDHHSLQPVRYYGKLPRGVADTTVIVLDPMLATGGSAAWTLSYLKEQGARSLHLATLVSAPEGIQMIQERHADVKITTAVIDRQLNEKGYILPGLGDAGDRLFGTEVMGITDP